eukprot:scaffold1419_cov410-Prasinococcus_capsulatus_cf.AAC.15
MPSVHRYGAGLERARRQKGNERRSKGERIAAPRGAAPRCGGLRSPTTPPYPMRMRPRTGRAGRARCLAGRLATRV